MYEGEWVRLVDFIIFFLKYPMKIKTGAGAMRWFK